VSEQRKCDCRKMNLPINGKIVIRCEHHRGRPSKKRLVCHFEDGMVGRTHDGTYTT